jgi:hypothetical protein
LADLTDFAYLDCAGIRILFALDLTPNGALPPKVNLLCVRVHGSVVVPLSCGYAPVGIDHADSSRRFR